MMALPVTNEKMFMYLRWGPRKTIIVVWISRILLKHPTTSSTTRKWRTGLNGAIATYVTVVVRDFSKYWRERKWKHMFSAITAEYLGLWQNSNRIYVNTCVGLYRFSWTILKNVLLMVHKLLRTEIWIFFVEDNFHSAEAEVINCKDMKELLMGRNWVMSQLLTRGENLHIETRWSTKWNEM